MICGEWRRGRAISRLPEGLGRAASGLLPVVAIGVLVVTSGAILAVAGDTLGYDFRAFHAAASRVLAGKPAYDTTYQVAGPYGLFLYPPTFLLLAIPFALLPEAAATWLWTGLLVAASAAAFALMPVSSRTRWVIVLLAGLSWPFVYALKLGQVGSLLLLAFALGWRALERPAVLGLSGAIGAAIKIQPGIVLAWAMLTRRWAAAVAGAAILLGLALVGTLVAGPGSWSSFALLIGRVSDPITTPHNFTPGAIAWQLGASRDAAAMIQWGTMAAVVLAVVFAALRRPAVPSYLVAVVASQLLSPILWDHYALVLLLPVAWLLDRGYRWAALIPLATGVGLVGWVPPAMYPMAFAATIVALLAASPRAEPARMEPVGA